MKKMLFIALTVFMFVDLAGQCLPVAQNMVFLDSWDNDNLYPSGSPGGHYSDVWGYASGGKEYGIIGGRDSIFIVDVTDPKDIFQVAGIYQGDTSVWRDFKVYNDYLFSIVDGGQSVDKGIVVYDLSGLPGSVTRVRDINEDFGRCHNIYIDVANARLYAVGIQAVSPLPDICVYDLSVPIADVEGVCYNLDTISPGSSNGLYIHDIFVRNNIAYCGHGYSGYYIWDFSNLDNVFELGSLDNSFFDSGYVHSSWNSDDNDHAVVATEVGPDPKLYWVDQSNPALMQVDYEFKDPRCSGFSVGSTAPHNPYIINDTIYVSDYADGIQVAEVNTATETLSKIGYFDTELINNSSTGYNGAWGVYPFLPSRTILASDRRNGLITLKYKELDTYTFIGPGSDWNTASNWDVGLIPPLDFEGIIVIASNCIKPSALLISGNALVNVKEGVTLTQE